MRLISDRIEQQRLQRIASWTAMALDYVAFSEDLALAVPSMLQASLGAHIRALSGRLARAHMDVPKDSRDRDFYSNTLDHIYSMADECRRAWASSVLRKCPDLADTLEAITAAMLSIAPADGAEELSEMMVMRRLYALDIEMSVGGLGWGADDWYEVRRAFQTQEAWISPAYLLSLRQLIRKQRVKAESLETGSVVYRHDPALYNWAIDRLDALKGSNWVEGFMLASLEAAKVAEGHDK